MKPVKKTSTKSKGFQDRKRYLPKNQSGTSFGPAKQRQFETDNMVHQKKKMKFEETDILPESPDLTENPLVKTTLKKLIAKPGSKWYEQITPSEFEKNFESNSNPNSELVSSLMKEADRILKEDELKYRGYLDRRKEKSDFAWIKTVIRTGTLSDKISAHTLLIQDSPVHNMNCLKILIGMVSTKGKRECLMSMDCLKDLFLSDLLPEEKKLKAFSERPLRHLNEMSTSVSGRKKILLFWYFEDQLKEIYSQFVKNLEAVSRDTIEKTKQRAVTIISELLKDSPEQEQFLLEALVNKIGDPVPKVGSHVCFLLNKLVLRHKKMISVVIQEVERLLFRNNVADRAKYYCLCFYSQLLLNEHQSNIANHLITIYFGLFKSCIRKGEINTKMMSALLTGVSRAYPYAKLKNNVMMEQLDAMFRLVHLVSFNISVQALMLIFQVLDSKDSISDRFYCALYKKLMDPALGSSSRQSMLLNLIYKALKKDVAKVRVKAFTKRLIQIAVYQAPNFQCGILMLISHLMRTHPDLLETRRAPIDSDSESDEHFEDITDHEEDEEDRHASKERPNPVNAPKVQSWVHRETKFEKVKKKYDPLHRNPLHAGAEFCNLWELRFLKNSFHPSVSLFAHQIYKGEDVTYSGDPLQDFTLIRFLDRFVYRNPKKQASHAAQSHLKVFGKRFAAPYESESVDITSDAYIRQTEEKVPVEERFIYRYLKKHIADGKAKTKDNSDIESIGDDEFESLLYQINPTNEDTLDFAKELLMNKQKSSKKNKVAAVNHDESDDEHVSVEEDSDFEEEELGFENDSEFQNAFGEISDMEENLENDNIAFDKPSKKKTKKTKNASEVGASTDEFDLLLEENTGKMAESTSEAFVNYDNAALKQLSWEKQRDQFVRGTDWKSRKNKFRKKIINKKRRKFH